MAWIYCLNTSTIRPVESLLEKIRIAAAAGFQAIELWNDEMTRHVEQGGSLEEIRRALEDAGLQVPSVISLRGWMDSEGEAYQQALDEARRRMEQAAVVGAPHIVATPAITFQPVTVNLDRVAQRYRKLLEIGREFDVWPAMEFLGFVTSIYRVDQAWEVVKRAGEPTGTIVLDPFHLFRGGSTLDDVPDLSGEHVAIFHFNDAPAEPPREQQEDRHRVLPGEGILPLREWADELQQRGYKGPVSLELFNPDLWAQDPLEVARRGLAKMREVLEG